MRLKEDKSNWNASSLIRKITPLPETDEYRKRKNTRQWCKGKVGREHEWDIVGMRHSYGFYAGDAVWFDYTCANCKKQGWQIIKRDE